MQSNPGPRPTVGSHSAIETVISGAYAWDEKRVFRYLFLAESGPWSKYF